MKKQIFSALAIGVIAITACNKKEVTPPAPGAATIEGSIKAPIDLSNDTTQVGVFISGLKNEGVLSGTLITAVIDTEDLQDNPQAGYTYEKIIRTTTIGSDGSFKFTDIPAYAKSIPVTLKFNDFQTNQKQFDTANNPDIKKTYTLSNDAVMVYKGAVVIKEYTYTAN